jgi:GDP-L-fucose synthase
MAQTFDITGKRVWVAGHRGMVGSAMVRRLLSEDCAILTIDRAALDLRRQEPVEAFVRERRPDVVVIAAAVVGGIQANSTLPAQFLYDNLAIATNIIHAAARYGVGKLMFLGSSCMYPRDAAQPMREDAMLTGLPEPTNQWYSVAKIAGAKLCQAYRRQHGLDFITVVPTNLYGPGDNYHPEHSHVPAALIRRMHQARLDRDPAVTIWGTGTPRREFMFADDLADACLFVLRCYSDEAPLNVGTGTDIAIADFARQVADAVGYQGRLVFDATRPDGAPRKLLDSTRLAELGWRAGTGLAAGLAATYRDFLAGGGRQRAIDHQDGAAGVA